MILAAQQGGQHHHDCVHFQGPGKYRGIVWIFKKIQIHNIFIIFLCKVKDRKCLAALSAALDNQWLAIFCVFPVNQFLLNFPFQHDSFASLILFYFSIAESNNFFKGVLTQTENFFKRLLSASINF